MQQTDTQIERQRRADEIIARLEADAANVLAKYPVEIAYLHGSVARGRVLPTSDVDIALVLTTLPPPYERVMLELDIRAALEDACRLSNIDIRTINHAPVLVQGRIVQEGIAKAYQRAMANARFKSARKDSWGVLGQSLWSTTLAEIEVCQATIPAVYEINPLDVPLTQIVGLTRDISGAARKKLGTV